jgi:hypothetical protein
MGLVMRLFGGSGQVVFIFCGSFSFVSLGVCFFVVFFPWWLVGKMRISAFFFSLFGGCCTALVHVGG